MGMYHNYAALHGSLSSRFQSLTIIQDATCTENKKLGIHHTTLQRQPQGFKTRSLEFIYPIIGGSREYNITFDPSIAR